MAFTSIYNFVPLNSQVFYPSWAEQVSQDAPFSDGEDGIIEVTFHNVSPLFIRNGNADRNNKEPYSAHIMIGGKRLYFLPGSSIKGMLRSTMEIMSFGKMTQFTDRYFGFREVGQKNLTTDGDAYNKKMKSVKAGWLRKQGENLILTPCDGEVKPINDHKLDKLYPSLQQANTAWQKNLAIAKASGKWYPYYEQDYKQYRIVCTGNIGNKKNDYLFPIERLDEITIADEEQINKFFTVHEPTPDFVKSSVKGIPTIKDFLDDGNELAVFYLPGNDTDTVEAIGLSRMFRYPYKNSVAMLVKAQQNPDPQRRDLTETIFGFTSKSDSLRGRVQVGNAFANKPLEDRELQPLTLGVLGQPKASFYPFYLRQTANPYKTYNNADGIAGRKLYRVHRGSRTTELPQGNGNENAISRFTPIPEGQVFHLSIAVHNLRKMETGALLSALTLHQTKGAWHNIGLAKGFGYGKLEIDSISLSKGFAYTVDDYLKAFESQMSLFTYTASKQMWADTTQVIRLMEIVGEHDDDVLKVMDLDQYGEARRNVNFELLSNSEKTVPVNSFLSASEKEKIREASKTYVENKRKQQWIERHKEEYNEAQLLASQQKFHEAIGKYNAIIDELTLYGLDHKAEDAAIQRIESAINNQHEKEQQVALAKREKEQQAKLNAGFGAQLEKRGVDGTPNAGKYMVTHFKQLLSQTDQWMKKARETALTDTEKEAYAKAFHRIYPIEIKNKAGAREMENKESTTWKISRQLLGDCFEELLGDLYNK